MPASAQGDKPEKNEDVTMDATSASMELEEGVAEVEAEIVGGKFCFSSPNPRHAAPECPFSGPLSK